MATWEEWRKKIAGYMPESPDFRPPIYGPLTSGQARMQEVAENALDVGTSFTGGALKGPFIRRFAVPNFGPNALSKGQRAVYNGLEKVTEFTARSAGADQDHDALPFLRAADTNQVGDFLTRKGRELGAGASSIHDFLSAPPGTPFKLINPDSAGTEALTALRESINPVEDESEELKKNEEVARATQLEAQVQAISAPEQASVKDRITTVDLPGGEAATVGGDDLGAIAQGADGQPSSGVMKSFLEDYDWYDTATAPLNMANSLVFGNQKFEEDGSSSGFPGVLGALGFGGGAKKSIENAKMAAHASNAMKLEDALMRSQGSIRHEDPAYAKYNKALGEQMESIPVAGQERPIKEASFAEQTASALGAFMFRDQQDQQDDLNRNYVSLQDQLSDKRSKRKGMDQDRERSLLAAGDNVRYREDEEDDVRADQRLSNEGELLKFAGNRDARGEDAEERAKRKQLYDMLFGGSSKTPTLLPEDSIMLKQGENLADFLKDPEKGREALESTIGDLPKSEWQNALTQHGGQGGDGMPMLQYKNDDWTPWTDDFHASEIKIAPGAHGVLPDASAVKTRQGDGQLRDKIEQLLIMKLITEDQANQMMGAQQ